MDRKEFANKLLALGLCPLAIQPFLTEETSAATLPTDDEKTKALTMEKEFVEHWLSDLIDSMEKELDRETIAKIVGGCGTQCFNRHSFKQDIAKAGDGDLDKLIEAYKKNFEIWKDGNTVHIRFGETSPGCYCPAARYRPAKPNDVHCECTRMTHQTIFQTALHKPYKVEIVDTVRRGGKTCHFTVKV